MGIAQPAPTSMENRKCKYRAFLALLEVCSFPCSSFVASVKKKATQGKINGSITGPSVQDVWLKYQMVVGKSIIETGEETQEVSVNQTLTFLFQKNAYILSDPKRKQQEVEIFIVSD